MFCKKCGNQLVDDATFCQKCGTKVKEDSPLDAHKSSIDQQGSVAINTHSNGSITLNGKELCITGFKKERRSDGTSGYTSEQQSLPVSDIKSIVIKNRPPLVLLIFSLSSLTVFTLLYIIEITQGAIHRIFDYSYARGGTFIYVFGLIMHIGGPLFGILFMLLFIKNRKKFGLIINHTSGSTESYINEEELNEAESFIAKFNAQYKQP